MNIIEVVGIVCVLGMLGFAFWALYDSLKHPIFF